VAETSTLDLFSPEDERELAEAIAGANAPFEIRGGSTKRALGNPVTAGRGLGTGRMRGISLYDPGALTLVAGAGTPLAEIEAALAAEGQMLPFEPPDWRGLLRTSGEPTIGGVVACNLSGPRRLRAGACRDALIGVRFVDGNGRIVKNGGRVMKNVTGYDLVKLLCGSYGTLGLITEVAFKVLPKPEAAAVLLLHGLTPERAIAAMAATLASPWEVSGAAHVPAGLDGDPVTMIRIEGFGEQVDYRSGRLKDLLAGYGPVEIETRVAGESGGHGTDAGWAWIRDVAALHGTEGDVWRLSVKPSEAAGIATRIGAERLVFDWGGGLIWAEVAPGTDLRARLGDFAGHATLIRAAAGTRRRLGAFHPEPAPLARIAQALRAKFDPRGILNPGRMG